MSINRVVEKLNLVPSVSEKKQLKKELDFIVLALKNEIKKQRMGAEVFIGGSFARGTLVKKKDYDVDIFIRFDWRYEDLTFELEKIINNASKIMKSKFIKIHGSRDYFRIIRNGIIFEVIPVLKINNPREARNVTDLSYFHVNYVKRKINNTMAREVVIAKNFCKAQGVYGAESYIQGFSGYALECLIIYYKSFEKMLKRLSKVKERIIIDPEKKYKNKDEALINLNESKIRSPVILVDPTWKERNVLAALNNESFKKFQDSARKFLKKPNFSYFIEKEIDISQLKNETKKKKAEFLQLKIETDRQIGDIAGTKMKKFSNFICMELENCFEIIRKEFVYDDSHDADLYIILKSKKEIVKIGPPIIMIEAVKAFKKSNKNTYIKNGMIHSKMMVSSSAKRFLELWKKKYSKKVKEMGIVGLKIN